MRIIKLNAIDSTNTYLRQLSNIGALEDYTVVVTKHQTNGRGQMGSEWKSQEAKNLTFSVFKDVSFLKLNSTFFLSLVCSLAVVRSLEQFMVPKLKVKWPNDILSESKKICGILIENVVKQGKVKATIIGIGLNVNQTEFKKLPQASSLLLITGVVYNTDELMKSILKNLKYFLKYLEENDHEFLINEYEKLLFRKDKPSSFKSLDDQIFSGIIKGISPNGNLIVLLEDNILKEFDLKEVSLLF